MKAEDKLLLLMQVYKVVNEATDSFENDDMLGPDLAYLMGAILRQIICSWDKNRRIIQVLIESFGPDHLVWNHIVIEDEDQG